MLFSNESTDDLTAIMQKIPMKSMSVFIAGTNLYTWTSYEGLDPEGSETGSISGVSLDKMVYPFPKITTIGIKLGF